jgi:hypothetical protein
VPVATPSLSNENFISTHNDGCRDQQRKSTASHRFLSSP